MQDTNVHNYVYLLKKWLLYIIPWPFKAVCHTGYIDLDDHFPLAVYIPAGIRHLL